MFVFKGYLPRHGGNFPYDTTLLKQQQGITLQTNPNDQMPSHIPDAWLLLHLWNCFLDDKNSLISLLINTLHQLSSILSPFRSMISFNCH